MVADDAFFNIGQDSGYIFKEPSTPKSEFQISDAAHYSHYYVTQYEELG